MSEREGAPMKTWDVRVTNKLTGSTYTQPVTARTTSEAKRWIGPTKDYKFESVTAR